MILIKENPETEMVIDEWLREHNYRFILIPSVLDIPNEWRE